VRPGPAVAVAVQPGQRVIKPGRADDARLAEVLWRAVLPVLAERQIAAPGQRWQQRHPPSAVAGSYFPVHVLAVNSLGQHLLDYLQVTELASACAAASRWSFPYVIAPLRLPTGTGSPVNPISIL
jgi:hypothetical protein